MKKAVCVFFAGSGFLLAAYVIARLWYAYPDVIPRFPESFWIWVSDLYGAQNAEDMGDAAMMVGLILSSVIVFLLILVVRFLWHRIKAR